MKVFDKQMKLRILVHRCFFFLTPVILLASTVRETGLTVILCCLGVVELDMRCPLPLLSSITYPPPPTHTPVHTHKPLLTSLPFDFATYNITFTSSSFFKHFLWTFHNSFSLSSSCVFTKYHKSLFLL